MALPLFVSTFTLVALGTPPASPQSSSQLLPDTETTAAPVDTTIPVLTQDLVAPVLVARRSMADVVRGHPELQPAVDKMSIPLKLTMVDIITGTPLLTEAVSKAGLTAQSYARVAAAINMAVTMDVIIRSVNPDMQAKGIVGANVAFVRSHRKELEPFGVTPEAEQEDSTSVRTP